MKTLSDEAREVALSMIEFCLDNHYCMGMNEGFNDDDTKEVFRVELEKLIKCKEGNVTIFYK